MRAIRLPGLITSIGNRTASDYCPFPDGQAPSKACLTVPFMNVIDITITYQRLHQQTLRFRNAKQ